MTTAKYSSFPSLDELDSSEIPNLLTDLTPHSRQGEDRRRHDCQQYLQLVDHDRRGGRDRRIYNC